MSLRKIRKNIKKQGKELPVLKLVIELLTPPPTPPENTAIDIDSTK